MGYKAKVKFECHPLLAWYLDAIGDVEDIEEVVGDIEEVSEDTLAALTEDEHAAEEVRKPVLHQQEETMAHNLKNVLKMSEFTTKLMRNWVLLGLKRARNVMAG